MEVKRTSTRVGRGIGSFPSRVPEEVGFKVTALGVMQNYGGSRSIGRNVYVNRGEFSGRPRGSAVREGRRGRSGCSSAPKHTSVSTSKTCFSWQKIYLDRVSAQHFG